MSLNLGFIGGGNMSTAIVRGILKNDAHPASNIWVSGPRLHNLEQWADLGTNITTKNGEVVSKCDIVFLGVKPGMLELAVTDCINTMPAVKPSKSVLFVSVLAGLTLEDLSKVLNILPLKIRVIRCMPNTPMMVGHGACLYAPDSRVFEADCTHLEKLLSGCGVCERVTESMIDNLGPLIGCGPAFIYIIIEALADGAVKQGVPRDIALRFAAQTVSGSGQMVLQTQKHPGELKDAVCSPGGSTICGVAALEDGRIRSTLIKAIEAATLRTKELRK